jgi:hypothetical protein
MEESGRAGYESDGDEKENAGIRISKYIDEYR